MYVLLTRRKLEPGSYDARRKAWRPEDMPEVIEVVEVVES